MISTIFIDTRTERLFPLAGNTREAVTEFVKNQIDLSFIALCNTSTIKYLQPGLSDAQAATVLAKLLTLPAFRRDDVHLYEHCVDEILLNIQERRHFIVSGWAHVYKHERLPVEHNHRNVIHSFGDTIEREFNNVCQVVMHAPFVEVGATTTPLRPGPRYKTML